MQPVVSGRGSEDIESSSSENFSEKLEAVKEEIRRETKGQIAEVAQSSETANTKTRERAERTEEIVYLGFKFMLITVFGIVISTIGIFLTIVFEFWGFRVGDGDNPAVIVASPRLIPHCSVRVAP